MPDQLIENRDEENEVDVSPMSPPVSPPEPSQEREETTG